MCRTVTTTVVLSIVLSITGAVQADEQSSGPKDRDHRHHRSIPARIAALEAAILTLQNQLNAANNTIGALQAALAAETVARQAADTTLQVSINNETAARQAADAQLSGGSALAQALAPYLSVDLNPINGLTGPHILFTGANVHVRSGLGFTYAPTNALGNLIVGYNEGFFVGIGARTGSHNLVVGHEHTYTSYGGFIVGEANKIIAPGASVSGGRQNTASGALASVSGGAANTATGFVASVSGGNGNVASGDYATASGSGNVASGFIASVSGGVSNSATGQNSSVSGGYANSATGLGASVSGGQHNIASDAFASVSGGNSNAASGVSTSVSGGFNCNTGSANAKWAVGQTAITGGCSATLGN